MRRYFPIVQYSEVYGQRPSVPPASLKGFNCDQVIGLIAGLNAILYLERKIHSTTWQLSVLKKIFPAINDRKRNLIKVVFARYRSKGGDAVLFCSPVLTKIIADYIRAEPSPNPAQTDELQLQQQLLDLILFENDIYFPQTTTNTTIPNYENLWLNYLNQQFYVRTRQRIHESNPLLAIFFKDFIIKNVPNGAQLIDEFCNHFKLQNFEHFVMVVLGLNLNSQWGYRHNKMISFTIPPSDPGYGFLEHLSLSASDLGTATFSTHFGIVPKPFWKNSVGELYVIDYNYLQFTQEFGLIYHFFQNTGIKNFADTKNYPLYKSFLGKRFYEEFLAKRILAKIFSRKNHQFFSEETKHFPDIAITINKQKLLLIEVKSASSDAGLLESKDVNKLKSYFTENYGQIKSRSGEKNKGVFQLLHSIRLFCNSTELNVLTTYPKRKVIIYPIIIYIDNVVDIPGANGYLDDLFQTTLDGISGVKEIKPVVAINLAYFITNFADLMEAPSLFIATIDDYIRLVRDRKRKFAKSQDTRDFWESNTSFDRFCDKIAPALHNFEMMKKHFFGDIYPD